MIYHCKCLIFLACFYIVWPWMFVTLYDINLKSPDQTDNEKWRGCSHDQCWGTCLVRKGVRDVYFRNDVTKLELQWEQQTENIAKGRCEGIHPEDRYFGFPSGCDTLKHGSMIWSMSWGGVNSFLPTELYRSIVEFDRKYARMFTFLDQILINNCLALLINHAN